MRKNSIACASCWKGASDPAMTAAFNLNAIAQTSAVQIVDCLVEGTLIAIFTGLVLSVIRRKNSGTRFAVWFSALMAIATLPLFATRWWSHVHRTFRRRARARPLPCRVPGRFTLSGHGRRSRLGSCSASERLVASACASQELPPGRSCENRSPSARDTRKEPLGEAGRSLHFRSGAVFRLPSGFVKPAIVIPAWVMQELSAGRIESDPAA